MIYPSIYRDSVNKKRVLIKGVYMTKQQDKDSSCVSVDNPKPLTNAFIDINLHK